MKRLAFIAGICALAFSPFASAQGVRYDNVAMTVRSGFVVPISGANVTVCTSGAAGTPCSPTTPIYLDAAMTQPISQPLIADSFGNYGFYAPTGSYTYTITAPGSAMAFALTLPSLQGLSFNVAQQQMAFVALPIPPPTGLSGVVTGLTGTNWKYVATEQQTVQGTVLTTQATAAVTISAAGTLNGTNFITLSATCSNTADQVQFWRTQAGTSPTTLGRIGSAAICASGIASLVDNGLAGDAATAPVYNSTGSFSAPDSPVINGSEHFGLGSAVGPVSLGENVAIGPNAIITGARDVLIGADFSSPSGSRVEPASDDVQIGAFLQPAESTGSNVVVGYAAVATGSQSVAVGEVADAGHSNSVALGAAAIVTSGGGIAVGNGASAAFDSVAVGTSAQVICFVCIALGSHATTANANEAIMGSATSGDKIASLVLGNGDTNAAPAPVSYGMTAGAGTNIVGGALTIKAGNGTGSGGSGALNLQTAPAAGAGSTANTYSTVLGILPSGIAQLSSHLFAALPACAAGIQGSLTFVTDSTTATWGASIAGSGSNKVLALCNGTNWLVD